MRILYVNFWTKENDGKHLLYCTDPKMGTDFIVSIPKRHINIIDFNELKRGQLTLPDEYSIKVAS